MPEAINTEQGNSVDSPPSGFKLRLTLNGHFDNITRIAWAADGKRLASASKDHKIQIWNTESGDLVSVLEGHTDTILDIAWAPYVGTLASVSSDDTIKLWDTNTGRIRKEVIKVKCDRIAWSPDGKTFVTGEYRFQKLRINAWNASTGRLLTVPPNSVNKRSVQKITDKPERVYDLADMIRFELSYTISSESYATISEDLLQLLPGNNKPGNMCNLTWLTNDQIVAMASNTLSIIDSNTMNLLSSMQLVNTRILNYAFSPNSNILVTTSQDGTIIALELKSGKIIKVLEGHADAVTSVTFSFDGQFLASKSLDDSVRIWRCETWETIAILPASTSNKWNSGLAFNPKFPSLATTGEEDTVIHIWELDFSALSGASLITSSVHYVNAKVVLVGDTGVGKSGIGLVLSGEQFKPTESTHGRRVWTFDKRGVVEANRAETHETLLWDLAGQPGYRLIHQLHLNEIAIALVIFDTRSETDPFAGVRHWDRALTQAQRFQPPGAPPLIKYLVAARADRGGIGVSRKRIETWVKELGFDGYFETSAKEGWQIPELAEAIRNSIDWKALPSVSSTKLFQHIKDYLISEKEAGRLLSSIDDLYRSFLQSIHALTETENLRSQFEICIGRVESRDLIRRLSFGNYVLLQPELLDAYASALINAAKDEPDGLGNIAEEDARHGRFRMSEDERIKDKNLEELLLISTVEELLCHELVLRESADDGMYLVFPSQFTREWPDAPNPQGQAVIFEFEGAVLNIYATLAVRLSRSGLFVKRDLWKNAATYGAKAGGLCGMSLREMQEGKGELTLFFDKEASEQTRSQFEDYILIHLSRRALSETIKQRRILTCHNCNVTIPEQHVQMRRERGLNWMDCSVCETRIALVEPDKDALITETQASILTEMDKTANLQRVRDTSTSSLQGKIITNDFDVFLCHNSDDKPAIKLIGEQLKDIGILPWLDEWELRPGLPWQRALEEQIINIKTAAVFIGKNDTGPWQNAELDAFLREFVKRKCPVIPVLLPDCGQQPALPVFLQSMTWVDFRQPEPDPISQLIWGITGLRAQ